MINQHKPTMCKNLGVASQDSGKPPFPGALRSMRSLRSMRCHGGALDTASSMRRSRASTRALRCSASHLGDVGGFLEIRVEQKMEKKPLEQFGSNVSWRMLHPKMVNISLFSGETNIRSGCFWMKNEIFWVENRNVLKGSVSTATGSTILK